MPCTLVTLPNGDRAIVCTSGKKPRCGCGHLANRLCDWKLPGRGNPTCDRPLCDACTHVPAPDKDLCPTHAAQWEARR